MKDIKNGCIAVLIIAVVIELFISINLYNEVKDRDNTIDIKNERIQTLQYELGSAKSAEEETYELFLDCVENR